MPNGLPVSSSGIYEYVGNYLGASQSVSRAVGQFGTGVSEAIRRGAGARHNSWANLEGYWIYSQDFHMRDSLMYAPGLYTCVLLPSFKTYVPQIRGGV
jgi:hypothetical protein